MMRIAFSPFVVRASCIASAPIDIARCNAFTRVAACKQPQTAIVAARHRTMDSLLLRIITLSMALIALPFIDDGLGVDALHAQQSQATALGRRSAGQRIAAAVASLTPFAVVARPEGVNKPELLPTTLVDGRRPNVID